MVVEENMISHHSYEIKIFKKTTTNIAFFFCELFIKKFHHSCYNRIEDDKMIEQKKKKWPIVLVILLLIVGIGGFFGYQYFQKKEQEKEEERKRQEQEKEVVEVALTEPQQEYLMSKIALYDGMLPYTSFEAKTLPLNSALQFIDSIKDKEYVDFKRGVSVSKIKQILKVYFGPDVVFKEEQSTCTDINACFVYDKENKRFQKETVATYPVKSKNFYLEGTQNKNTKEIKIKVHQLYYLPVPEGEYVFYYFKTPEEALQNINPVIDMPALYKNTFTNVADYPNYVRTAYQNIQATLTPITYHFKYQSSQYYLESVVK